MGMVWSRGSLMTHTHCTAHHRNPLPKEDSEYERKYNAMTYAKLRGLCDENGLATQ